MSKEIKAKIASAGPGGRIEPSPARAPSAAPAAPGTAPAAPKKLTYGSYAAAVQGRQGSSFGPNGGWAAENAADGINRALPQNGDMAANVNALISRIAPSRKAATPAAPQVAPPKIESPAPAGNAQLLIARVTAPSRSTAPKSPQAPAKDRGLEPDQ